MMVIWYSFVVAAVMATILGLENTDSKCGQFTVISVIVQTKQQNINLQLGKML